MMYKTQMAENGSVASGDKNHNLRTLLGLQNSFESKPSKYLENSLGTFLVVKESRKTD